jgi:Fic family protein
MARFIRDRRRGDPAGVTRAEREGYSFRRYEADCLATVTIELPATTWAAIARATGALGDAESRVSFLGSTEALGRILLRAEAIASSRIEGLEVSPRKLLEAEYLSRSEAESRHSVAGEVLGNIEAMGLVTDRIAAGHEIVLDDILDTHRELMRRSPLPDVAGKPREAQNWIGGADPSLAAFVPPEPGQVLPLLRDLIEFIDTSELPPLAIAAIAHAQFETIHPFADGNGRTGRALIHMILRSKGLTAAAAPPVSLSFATRSAEYVAALTRFRYEGDPESPAATAGRAAFVDLFCAAVTEVSGQMERFEREVSTLQATWRGLFAGVRSDSAVWPVIELLPVMPIVTARSLEEVVGRSFRAANDALELLAERGVVVQRSIGRRNRVFEATAIIEATALLERRLASPALDTAVQPPARRVPAAPPQSADDTGREVS